MAGLGVVFDNSRAKLKEILCYRSILFRENAKAKDLFQQFLKMLKKVLCFRIFAEQNLRQQKVFDRGGRYPP